MKNSLIRIVKWFCRQLTFNELASAVVIFHDVLSNSRDDIVLKPKPKPPHYRRFRVDTLPPILKSDFESEEKTLSWVERKKEIELKTGKDVSPVKRSKGKSPPAGCVCGICGAPSKYLYLNNGKINSQVRCKICGKTSPTHNIKRISKAKYLCPYCSYSLFKWKDSKENTIYKCPNYKCPHYLYNKATLNKEEKEIRDTNKYDPNFKLHYQYREYHISPDDLAAIRPKKHKYMADLRNIHNSYHTLGLILTFTINLGLSSRVTQNALKGIFDISVSHKTVLNYVNSTAYFLSDFIDRNCPIPKSIAAADETYIIVNGAWTYTWFIIDSKTRAISAYNLSQDRGTQPALALLYNCYGTPDKYSQAPEIVTDGNPSYDSAVMAYNHLCHKETGKLTKKTVIGLKNMDEESTEYREFKQLVERLNRTYKYHTRPRSGFKSFDGAVALTTLFVAYYNFMRPHGSKNNQTPVPLSCLKTCKLMPEKWITMIKQAA